MSDLNAWERTQKRNQAEKTAVKNVVEKVEKLFALNKSEQVKILNNYGIEEVPNYEKDRVILILKLETK